MLEARAIHTGRSAYNHLLAMAQTHGIGARARRRGDRARRAAATSRASASAASRSAWASGWASPPRCSATRQTLILDEPANGLDPEGILWIRNLLKGLAAEGRTVFLSSHLMSEMALTAEHLVVIGRGRLIADTTRRRGRRAGLERRRACASARRDADALRAALLAEGAAVDRATERGVLEVHGLRQRARSASSPRSARSSCTSSRREHASLEEAFMRLTGDAVEYHARPDARATWSRPHERRRGTTRRRPRPAARARHAGPRHALRVDQALDAALDALVAARRRRRDGRPRHRSSPRSR